MEICIKSCDIIPCVLINSTAALCLNTYLIEGHLCKSIIKMIISTIKYTKVLLFKKYSNI